MYEKIFCAFITGFITLLTIWIVCGRDSHRRSDAGAGSNIDRATADIDRAREDNKRLAEEEQRTRDTIERAEATVREQGTDIDRARDNVGRGQALIDRARSILHSAQHTDQYPAIYQRTWNWFSHIKDREN